MTGIGFAAAIALATAATIAGLAVPAKAVSVGLYASAGVGAADGEDGGGDL